MLKILLGYFQKHLSIVLDPSFALKKQLLFMTVEHDHLSLKGSEPPPGLFLALFRMPFNSF